MDATRTRRIENLVFALLLALIPLVNAERPMRPAPAAAVARTNGFSEYEVSLMPTGEKEARFVAVTDLGGYGGGAPITGWDSEIDGDTTYYYRIWLEALLWPSEYPPGWPPHVCSDYELACEGAANLGIYPVNDETAEALVSRVLAEWPLESRGRRNPKAPDS